VQHGGSHPVSVPREARHNPPDGASDQGGTGREGLDRGVAPVASADGVGDGECWVDVDVGDGDPGAVVAAGPGGDVVVVAPGVRTGDGVTRGARVVVTTGARGRTTAPEAAGSGAGGRTSR
jgi:hypothetical protein